MNLQNKSVLVIGLARSGMAAIKVLHKKGAKITLSESKKKEDIKELDILNEMGVRVVGQSKGDFEGEYDLAVKNPGVPLNNPVVLYLNKCGVPVITEIELAFCVAKPQHFVAVTGTNGKTTTSTLVYNILNKAFGKKAHLCGNIGIPLCEIVMENKLYEESGHYIALEISNFQLVNIDKFRPEAAAILNLTPDHVDFMGSLDAYYRSKVRVYENMGEGDTFILNLDDPEIVRYTSMYPIKCDKVTFSLDSTDADSYIKDGFLYVRGEKVLPTECIRLVGKHNLQNVMTAVCLAKAVGADNESVVKAVSEFTGVEHRIEFVREKNGVKYYNDSKGTNTDATITALKAFDKGVILLVGGFEKGLSMDEMKKHLGCVKKVIGFGACGKRLVTDLVGDDGIVVTTLDEAVNEAVQISESGDVILLSPTTSSFDQYSCFEERGEHFKKIVNAL